MARKPTLRQQLEDANADLANERLKHQNLKRAHKKLEEAHAKATQARDDLKAHNAGLDQACTDLRRRNDKLIIQSKEDKQKLDETQWLNVANGQRIHNLEVAIDAATATLELGEHLFHAHELEASVADRSPRYRLLARAYDILDKAR